MEHLNDMLCSCSNDAFLLCLCYFSCGARYRTYAILAMYITVADYYEDVMDAIVQTGGTISTSQIVAATHHDHA